MVSFRALLRLDLLTWHLLQAARLKLRIQRSQVRRDRQELLTREVARLVPHFVHLACGLELVMLIDDELAAAC